MSRLDLLVIQIDGMHMVDDLMLVGAVGIDGMGDKHLLGAIEGAGVMGAGLQLYQRGSSLRDHTPRPS